MNQYVNQFAMTPEKGMLTLAANVNVLTAVVKRDGSNTLTPAMAVKLVDVTDSEIIVDAAAATDAIFGFVTLQVIKNSYPIGSRVEIAFRDCVMNMTAGAAIVRGAKLEIVAASTKVITNAGVNQVVGLALDKAAADGDIIRVLILSPDVNQIMSFTDLSDTPDTYSGSGLKNVRVNTGATALEFHATSFLDLSDTPDTYAASASYFLKVNGGATAVVFSVS